MVQIVNMRLKHLKVYRDLNGSISLALSQDARYQNSVLLTQNVLRTVERERQLFWELSLLALLSAKPQQFLLSKSLFAAIHVEIVSNKPNTLVSNFSNFYNQENDFSLIFGLLT
ncbi:hypothetical protein FGO68_gene17126 [Halteria grandinella]|uniref:Uncharacterized protein n=1 Tax=Halteria grandinella TaxID=5974 RepID=A0A8J8STS1_HALGN|nr:hypothetical protein FGO68_gene17126 [Halteria grandinella]